MIGFTDELENAETILFTLAKSIEAKDSYTAGHCKRLSELSVALADRLDLSEEFRVALRRGGIVHDLGKVAVPEHILLKSSGLTDEEWHVMKEHPVVGERICRPLRSFRHVLPIIRHHHEKLDGSGYPDGLKGEQIPLTARILQIVDIYDALTSDRPYRKALPLQEALAVIRGEVKRGWWDGSLVDELEALEYHCAPAPLGVACRQQGSQPLSANKRRLLSQPPSDSFFPVEGPKGFSPASSYRPVRGTQRARIPRTQNVSLHDC